MGIVKKHYLLIIIFVLSIFLRLININWSLPNQYHTLTYNCDEGTAIAALQGMKPSEWDFNPTSELLPDALREGTFNLYTYAALLKIFSFIKIVKLVNSETFYFNNIDEWAKIMLIGRLLSVLYGILTVWLVYILALKMFGKRTALLSAFFLSIMPAHVVYSKYLLMNVPGIFWIVFSYIFLKNILDCAKTKDYFFSGMGIGFAFATRFSGLPLFAVLFFTHFISKQRKELGKLFIAVFAAFLFFAIGNPYAILDYPAFLHGFKTVGDMVTGSDINLLKNILHIISYFNESMSIIIFFISVCGIILSLVVRRNEDWILLLWVFIMLTLFIRSGEIASPGRILPIMPFLAILGARFIAFLLEKNKIWVNLFLFSAVIFNLEFNLAYIRLAGKTDIRDTSSEWIAQNIKPNSKIGLIKEPSWFSPGIIDRKYRHPDHKHLPDYKFVSLASKDWKSYAGYENLEKLRPDYIIITDFEIKELGAENFPEKLANELGYEKIKDFKESLFIPPFKIRTKIPEMLYTPNYIYIFRKI